MSFSSPRLPTLASLCFLPSASCKPTLQGTWTGQLDCPGEEMPILGYLEGEVDVDLVLLESDGLELYGTLDWDESLTGDSELTLDAEFDVEVLLRASTGPQVLSWTSTCTEVVMVWGESPMDYPCTMMEDMEEIDAYWDGTDLLEMDGMGCDGDIHRVQ